MATGPFRTNYRVWAFVAVCLFVALGFVDPLTNVTWKGDHSLWSYFARFLAGDYYCSTPEMLFPIVVRGLMQTVPAVAIGWVLQAFVVILWPIPQGKPPDLPDR